MIYLTSDWHVYHQNILKYADRPFKDLEEMTETILENYFDTIQDGDMVFHLGDLTIKRGSTNKAMTSRFFSMLPENRVLVPGNHDYYTQKFYIEECGFRKVCHYMADDQIAMTHNPKHFKDRDLECGKILLHGHLHAYHPVIEFNELGHLNSEMTYDVGIDANNFKPVSLDSIKEFFKDGIPERFPKDQH